MSLVNLAQFNKISRDLPKKLNFCWRMLITKKQFFNRQRISCFWCYRPVVSCFSSGTSRWSCSKRLRLRSRWSDQASTKPCLIQISFGNGCARWCLRFFSQLPSDFGNWRCNFFNGIITICDASWLALIHRQRTKRHELKWSLAGAPFDIVARRILLPLSYFGRCCCKFVIITDNMCELKVWCELLPVKGTHFSQARLLNF